MPDGGLAVRVVWVDCLGFFDGFAFSATGDLVINELVCWHPLGTVPGVIGTACFDLLAFDVSDRPAERLLGEHVPFLVSVFAFLDHLRILVLPYRQVKYLGDKPRDTRLDYLYKTEPLVSSLKNRPAM
mgnify:FL=1